VRGRVALSPSSRFLFDVCQLFFTSRLARTNQARTEKDNIASVGLWIQAAPPPLEHRQSGGLNPI